MPRFDRTAVVEGSACDAALEAPRAKLSNAGLLSPLCHGDECIGLSGLYAIVNAIRLTLAHKLLLNGPDVHALMTVGFRFLRGRLTPEQSVLCGLRVALWRAAAEAMVRAAQRRFGVRIILDRLFTDPPWSRTAAFDTLEQAIMQMRVPMILCRGGHYTVVSGFTGTSLLLFDSGGGCWMAKRVCGVPGDGDNARHVIYPASFLALMV